MVTAAVNSIFVIESLPDGERKTGTELYQDVIKRYAEYYAKGDEAFHRFLVAKDKDQFIEALKYIQQCAKYLRRGVIIHLECHGLNDKSGLYLADGSSVSWAEVKPYLIELNVSLENELYVTMATCYGRYLHEAIDISSQAPFSGFISASKDVWDRETLEDYSAFFEQLLAARDILEAFKVLESRKSKFYYKDVETLFNELIRDWLRNMKEDEGFRNQFADQCKTDYERVRRPEDPAFDEMPFNEILEIVKVEFVSKYRKVFLFGKGRGK